MSLNNKRCIWWWEGKYREDIGKIEKIYLSKILYDYVILLYNIILKFNVLYVYIVINWLNI